MSRRFAKVGFENVNGERAHLECLERCGDVWVALGAISISVRRYKLDTVEGVILVKERCRLEFDDAYGPFTWIDREGKNV